MVDNYETITVAVGLPLMPALKVVAVLRVRPRNKSYQMIRSFQLLQPLRAAAERRLHGLDVLPAENSNFSVADLTKSIAEYKQRKRKTSRKAVALKVLTTHGAKPGKHPKADQPDESQAPNEDDPS